jgi:hypothetical protein
MSATLERRLVALEKRVKAPMRYIFALSEKDCDGTETVKGRDSDVTVMRQLRETDETFQKRYRAALGVTDADVLVMRRIIGLDRLVA